MLKRIELSLEQEFSIRAFECQVQQMSCEQAQELLIKLYYHMIARELIYKDLIKHQWNL